MPVAGSRGGGGKRLLDGWGAPFNLVTTRRGGSRQRWARARWARLASRRGRSAERDTWGFDSIYLRFWQNQWHLLHGQETIYYMEKSPREVSRMASTVDVNPLANLECIILRLVSTQKLSHLREGTRLESNFAKKFTIVFGIRPSRAHMYDSKNITYITVKCICFYDQVTYVYIYFIRAHSY